MNKPLISLLALATLLFIPFCVSAQSIEEQHQILMLFSNNVHGELEPCG